MTNPSTGERLTSPPQGTSNNTSSVNNAPGGPDNDWHRFRRRAWRVFRASQTWIATLAAFAAIFIAVRSEQRATDQEQLALREMSLENDRTSVRVIGYSASAIESALSVLRREFNPERPSEFFAVASMDLARVEGITATIEKGLQQAPPAFWKSITPIRALIADTALAPGRLSTALKNEGRDEAEQRSLAHSARQIKAAAGHIAKQYHLATKNAYAERTLEASGQGHYFCPTWEEVLAARRGASNGR